MLKQKRRNGGWIFFGAGLAALLAVSAPYAVTNIPQERALEFTEKLVLKVQQPAKNLKVWVPTPLGDAYQKAELIKVDAPIPYRQTRDPDFDNPLLYFEAKRLSQAPLIIQLTYRIVRKEQSPLGSGPQSKEMGSFPLKGYLKPRGLEIINGQIKEIAAKTTEGLSDPMEKAAAIYRYVLKHMKYDKSGTGWGTGNSVYACDVGKGNCTDFHSLFITLARASGIPARFRMGIPLPTAPEGKPSGGYHCWAEFYLEDKGWIPVDISEAWKDPKKADYLFGNLDTDRIVLSTGREILLSPKQSGARLNYLSKPYVEVNGKPFNDFILERSYKNINAKNGGKGS